MGAFSTVPVEAVKREVTAPTYVDNRVMVATAAQTHTKPNGAHWLWIDATDTIYVRFDGSAAVVPTVAVTDGSGSQPILSGNGILFNVRGITSVSIVSAGTPIVGLSWYADAGGR
jgi:hypothetical protein